MLMHEELMVESGWTPDFIPSADRSGIVWRGSSIMIRRCEERIGEFQPRYYDCSTLMSWLDVAWVGRVDDTSLRLFMAQ